MRRFVILGLPRSGSTYLMTLLNMHPDVICSGEQFNPYAAVDVDWHDDSHATVLGRDKNPVAHMNAFFDSARACGAACGGFKYMIGHNLKILQELERDPDITILNIWRENRLAQVSSLMKASLTKRWTQTKPDAHIALKINASPRDVSQDWHRFATFDHLIAMWLENRPNPRVTYEYRDLFKPNFERDICDFLGVPHVAGLKSPLVKQGQNSVIDRFEQPKPLIYYFHQLGLGHWLDTEL